MNFGKIIKIQLRDIWKTEDKDFTPWLEKNIDVLSEELGIQIEIERREAEVGTFSLDLLGRNLDDNTKVIIENQFGPTDHDHLGKLLTYAAAYEAASIIWIAESIRDEHKQALEWLNKRTDSDTDFFAVTIEAFKIEDSKPAMKFVPVVCPNEWQKGKKWTPTNSPSEREMKYKNYFQGLIDELRDKYKFTNARIGQYQSWYAFTSGVSGLVYSAAFTTGKRFKVEYYIDVGDKEENKKIFDGMYSEKEEIEKEFGESLEWERLEAKRASRIAIYSNGSIEDSDDKLNEYKKWMIDELIKIKSTLPNHANKYLA